MNQLHPKSFALACGTVWALGVALLAFVAMVHGTYGRTVISITSSIYLGYSATVPGIVLGAIWGFIDGWIGGYLLAWFYNYFLQPRNR